MSALPEIPAPDVAADATAPFVSVVVPCRNERPFIAECLGSILAGGYPADRLEVVVVDGMSDDGTRDLLAALARNEPRLRVLDNPARTTPAALNIGVRAARGDVVVRMDAHSHYPPHYVPRLVEWLERSGADNVGGVWRTRPANSSAKAQGIALALSHPLGVGNARYRLGVSVPTWVDTVPFGCYRRAVFERIGLFDESLVRNQDDELNHRLLKQGGRILLVPDVWADYYARDSFAKLWRTFYQYGYFKPLVALRLRRVFTIRQLAPPAFAFALLVLALAFPWMGAARLALGGLLAVYAATCVAVALHAHAGQRATLRVAPALMASLPVVHLGYGVGFLRGIADVFLRLHRGTRDTAAIPITR